MQSLNLCITVILFLFSTLFHSHSEKVLEHKTYCPEDIYGQEYLKFYNMAAFLTTWTTTSPSENITIPTIDRVYLNSSAEDNKSTFGNKPSEGMYASECQAYYHISTTGLFNRLYYNNIFPNSNGYLTLFNMCISIEQEDAVIDMFSFILVGLLTYQILRY